jgi:hypothetical protein
VAGEPGLISSTVAQDTPKVCSIRVKKITVLPLDHEAALESLSSMAAGIFARAAAAFCLAFVPMGFGKSFSRRLHSKSKK